MEASMSDHVIGYLRGRIVSLMERLVREMERVCVGNGYGRCMYPQRLGVFGGGSFIILFHAVKY
jgi:hypothetical protein